MSLFVIHSYQVTVKTIRLTPLTNNSIIGNTKYHNLKFRQKCVKRKTSNDSKTVYKQRGMLFSIQCIYLKVNFKKKLERLIFIENLSFQSGAINIYLLSERIGLCVGKLYEANLRQIKNIGVLRQICLFKKNW